MHKFSFKKVSFPTATAIISFVLFLTIYMLINFTCYHPYYIKGLLFAVPCVIFVLIAFLAEKNILKPYTYSILSVLFITLSLICNVSLFCEHIV